MPSVCLRGAGGTHSVFGDSDVPGNPLRRTVDRALIGVGRIARVLSFQHLPDRPRDLPLRQRLHGKRPDTRRLCRIGIDELAETRAHDDRHVGP